jgi:AcrR family transcriptional regulator
MSAPPGACGRPNFAERNFAGLCNPQIRDGCRSSCSINSLICAANARSLDTLAFPDECDGRAQDAYACAMAAGKQRPYRQVARAETQQRTRTALLDAATEEFYGGRWQQVSLEALAKRAGTTKQTLLRHFGSKEDLLLQTLLRAYQEIHAQRWSAPRGNLKGTIDNLLDHYEKWGERARRMSTFHGDTSDLDSFARAARQFHYTWVEYAFDPWLQRHRGKARERCRASLIVLCDVHTWWTLSHDLELTRAEVHATLSNLIKATVEQPG